MMKTKYMDNKMLIFKTNDTRWIFCNILHLEALDVYPFNKGFICKHKQNLYSAVCVDENEVCELSFCRTEQFVSCGCKFRCLKLFINSCEDITKYLGITVTSKQQDKLELQILRKDSHYQLQYLLHLRANNEKLSDDDKNNCVVCMERLKSVMLYPCLHLCLCAKCGIRLTDNCPICRCNISKALPIINT